AGGAPAAPAAATGSALAAAIADDLPYDLVISAGIGGGFPAARRPAVTGDTATATADAAGDGAGAGAAAGWAVVVADAIVAADLGAETPDGFASVTELGFGTVEHRPPAEWVRAAVLATGGLSGPVLTVSTVTGSAARASELTTRHPRALAEAMEGFGVAEAAAGYRVPTLEVRTVSNPVGPRDRAAWQIGAALDALAGAFTALARTLPGAVCRANAAAPEESARAGGSDTADTADTSNA
ncbi:futalosine hydrolase, partial [Streptomyces sp. HSW2009]|uniref:futalosine hydrolase n=1 Tax=Streptomyces sp. HSW2009 TaxID=3142890 RepID=UPI0032ECEB73